MFLSESNSHHHLVAVFHQRLTVYRMHWGSLNVCGGCGLDMTIESCDKDDGATHVYLAGLGDFQSGETDYLSRTNVMRVR